MRGRLRERSRAHPLDASDSTRLRCAGRGKPTLCTRCDAAQLARHVAMFEMARLSALQEIKPVGQGG